MTTGTRRPYYSQNFYRSHFSISSLYDYFTLVAAFTGSLYRYRAKHINLFAFRISLRWMPSRYFLRFLLPVGRRSSNKIVKITQRVLTIISRRCLLSVLITRHGIRLTTARWRFAGVMRGSLLTRITRHAAATLSRQEDWPGVVPQARSG